MTGAASLKELPVAIAIKLTTPTKMNVRNCDAMAGMMLAQTMPENDRDQICL